MTHEYKKQLLMGLVILALIVALLFLPQCAYYQYDPCTNYLKNLTPIEAMRYARDIHVKYTKAPEGHKTGSHAWHQEWIKKYNAILKGINE